MSDIYIVIDDLKNRYNHEFVFDIYEHTKRYSIVGLCCKICYFKMYIYLAINNYNFEKQLNFTHIIKINNVEYAYDNTILSCEEEIIKNIIE